MSRDIRISAGKKEKFCNDCKELHDEAIVEDYLEKGKRRALSKITNAELDEWSKKHNCVAETIDDLLRLE